jgi:hypothetical protein
MKKIFLGLILLSSFTISNAQLTNAILALEENDIKSAKNFIDKQMLKEKSATDPKSWFYKGKVYSQIYVSTVAGIKSLVSSDSVALVNSIGAYKKSISLDKPEGEFIKKSKLELEILWVSVFNDAINNYANSKNYNQSLKSFLVCQDIKPEDTLAYVYGASVAIMAENYAAAKKSYLTLINKNYKNYSYYKQLLFIALEKDKNTSDALQILGDARKMFPADNYFLIEEVNLLIKLKREQEAINNLTELLTKDKSNAKVYYFNLGVIYTNLKDNKKARESFASSLAIDSLYEESNFMAGYVELSEAEVINKKVNDMNLKEYQTNGKKQEAVRDAYFKKAIPFLERSYKVKKDEKMKSQLTNLYTRLKMLDKLKKLQ